MALSEDERLEVAAELMASIGGPADPEWEQAWTAELEERVKNANGEPAEPWEAVRARLFPGLQRKTSQ